MGVSGRGCVKCGVPCESLLSGGNGSRFCANAQLSDDETVAKMGRPDLL
jgi:hypothetical protein